MADKKNNKRNMRNNDEDYNPKFRKARKKVCPLCADKNLKLDYKNADQLRKFINDNDTVIMRGFGEKDGIRVGFGEVSGKILPAN